MARLSPRSYDLRLMLAMVVYVAVFLALWPYVRSSADPLVKTACALVPVLPMLYVIWLMAERVLRSDELEQRTHLIGIGVAAIAVALVSLVSGFLAAAGLLTLDSTAAVLVWIFPILMLVYGAARTFAARHYGSLGCEDDRVPLYQRFLFSTAVTAFMALVVFLRSGALDVTLVVAAVSATQLLAAIWFGVKRRRAGATAS